MQNSASSILKTSNASFESLWFARISILIIIGLQLLLNEHLTVGPNWLAPTLEAGFVLMLFGMSHERRIGRPEVRAAGPAG